MKKRIILATVLILAALGVAASQIIGTLQVTLSGYEEVPAVSTAASAEFRMRVLNEQSGPNITNDGAIQWELYYQNLEGSITQAHIHFGQEGVNGGISVWLCGNPPLTPPAGTQPCPPSPGYVRGTIRATEVVGPAAQGIEPGAYNELLRAMQAGKTYVNVHSTKFPGGEVRAQIVRESNDSIIRNGTPQ
jgi:hypothetical protein